MEQELGETFKKRQTLAAARLLADWKTRLHDTQ